MDILACLFGRIDAASPMSDRQWWSVRVQDSTPSQVDRSRKEKCVNQSKAFGTMFYRRLLSAVFILVLFQAAGQTPQTFNQIQFTITTGDDNLRGDSSATATLISPGGVTLQVLTLKDQHDNNSWDNNSTHIVSLTLSPPRSAADIGQIVVALQTHNGPFENDDKWNVNSVTVTLANNGAGQTQLVSGSGNPLQIVTTTQTLTLTTQGPPGTFNQIQFTITTGDDNLRGDSSATATLISPSGATLQVLTLKDQHDNNSWDNNSTRTIPFALNPLC
jgi:hypothetical protein